jgi:hypothetical protein
MLRSSATSQLYVSRKCCIVVFRDIHMDVLLSYVHAHYCMVLVNTIYILLMHCGSTPYDTARPHDAHTTRFGPLHRTQTSLPGHKWSKMKCCESGSNFAHALRIQKATTWRFWHFKWAQKTWCNCSHSKSPPFTKKDLKHHKKIQDTLFVFV